MPRQFSVLLLDVDGVLVRAAADALPSDRVIAAVRAAQSYLRVALATGRSLEHTQPVIDSLGLTGLSIFSGGAEIVDVSTGQLIHQKTLPPDKLKELVRVALAYGYGAVAGSGTHHVPIESLEDVQSAAATLEVLSVAAWDAPKVAAALRRVAGVAIHVTALWGADGAVDMRASDKFADKGYGAQALLRREGFSQDQAMAIGDGPNDLALFKAVRFSVAMSNAPARVQRAADAVAPSLDDDGAAAAIEEWVLGT